MSEVLTPEVVAAVKRHMNDDHRDDALRIVQGLGARPDATEASMADLTSEGAVFEAAAGDRRDHVTVPWARPIAERMDIRLDIVRMHDEACAALGIEPPAAEEH